MKKKIFVLLVCVALLVGILSGCTTQQETEPVNNAPVANFSYDITDKTATFTDASTDEDNNELNYIWTFGDDETSTEQNPVHTYAENDTYVVTLTVSDGTDEDSMEYTVIVGNIAPTADFSYEATNLSAIFTDLSTDPNGGDTIVGWSWDFNGDDVADNETQGPVTYVYEAAGTYNATLTVTDDYGLTNQKMVSVTVTE